jgi:hypothetical protein
MSFPNRVKFSVGNSPGLAGDIIVSNAADSFKTFGSGDNGKVVDILITEGSNWELRKDCTYTHSTTTLSRGTLVEQSSAFAFTSAAQVAVVLLGERVLPFFQTGAFKSHGQALVYDQFEDAWTNSNNTIPDQLGNEFLFLTTDGSVTSWASVPSLPTQTGNSGKYLSTDGTNASWVTSPIPSVTGNSGKYLTNNGVNTSWASAPNPIGYVYGGSILTTPVASGEDSIAIGDGAISSTTNSIAIGKGASCAGTTSLTIGANASIGSGANNILIGSSAVLGSPTNTLSIGNSISSNASYPYSWSTIIGNSASCSNGSSVVIGHSASANGFGNSQSTTVGAYATGYGTNSVTVGYSSDSGPFSGSTAVGAYSLLTGANSIALGFKARGVVNSIAIGYYSDAGSYGICLDSLPGGNYFSAKGSGTINLNFHFTSAGAITATNCILMNATGGNLGAGFLGTTPSNSVYLVSGGGNNNFGSVDSSQIAIGMNLAPRLFGQVQLRGTKGFENASNDSQFSFVELRTKTTNATQTKLWLNYTDYTTGTKNLTLQTNSAIMFKARIIAISNANQAGWNIEGVIYQGANAASTVFVGTPIITTIGKSAGASSWDIVVTANTTLGSLDLLATGAAATNIHWYAKVDLHEIIV